jgi:hypothetical protein
MLNQLIQRTLCILAILMNCHLVVGSFYPWSCHCRISIINSTKVLNKIETTKQYSNYFSDIQNFILDYNVSSTKAQKTQIHMSSYVFL